MLSPISHSLGLQIELIKYIEDLSMFSELFPRSHILKIPIKFVWSSMFNKNDKKRKTCYYILSITNFFNIKAQKKGTRIFSVSDFPLGYYVSQEPIRDSHFIYQEWIDSKDRDFFAFEHSIAYSVHESVQFIKDLMNFKKKIHVYLVGRSFISSSYKFVVVEDSPVNRNVVIEFYTDSNFYIITSSI